MSECGARGFPAVTFLHLPVKVIQLFTERAQQHGQALAVEFICPAAALFKNTGGQVFKLSIQALLTVKQQPLFFFGGQAAFFQPVVSSRISASCCALI